ncbi:MAG: RodZ domain-containing protein [Anaerolineae bacterium]
MTDSLGVWLRRSREARQLELEDVVRALHIRRRYLQALEMGDYEAMPGPIQARGFLRNYARYLGMPVEDVLARYDAEVRGHPVQPRVPDIEVPTRRGERTWAPPPPSVEDERAAVRANASGGLLRVLAAALFFFGLLALASFLWLQFGQNEPVQTAAPTLSATQSGAARSTPTPTIQPTPIFPVSADGTVRVRLVPQNHAWISVSADERVVFQGIAEPQQIVEATAEEILIVSTGNGGAFRLYVNGTDWGALGEQGEVIRRAWSPNGETSLGDS